ncbi:hypothetical protein [Haloarcula argentinensis]|uniref:Uncharacterized protein n=1 Tax=Haloarcula argentinensis TaxID=43776 RepID=A0A830FTD2_HALAR|nr:hypothetical protein [Haloarcula argentinensis]GGM37235.1 hypothetical protein GCM10009006_17980 [Haloarcula argentinensis]
MTDQVQRSGEELTQAYSSEDSPLVEDQSAESHQNYSDTVSGDRIENIFEDSQTLAEIDWMMSRIHPEPDQTAIIHQIRELIESTDKYIDKSGEKTQKSDINSVTDLLEEHRVYKEDHNSPFSNKRQGTDPSPGNENSSEPGSTNNTARAPSPREIILASLALTFGALVFTVAGIQAIQRNLISPALGSAILSIIIVAGILSLMMGIQFKDGVND